jgi:hypothetical protein
LVTSGLLLFFGDSNPYFLYLGTGLMGFFICFQASIALKLFGAEFRF